MIRLHRYLLICLTLILMGCGSSPPAANPPDGEPIRTDLELLQRIKDEVGKVSGVDEVVVAIADEEIGVGVKVSGFDRFRLRSIRSDVHRRVDGLTTEDYCIHVTTDKRLFRDLGQLEARLERGDTSPEIRSRLGRINEEMEG
ncbi:MAG: YhcN/YlaJ family sporulation lipoprotein [Limnochordia bacterium]|jgi:hypothetical protein